MTLLSILNTILLSANKSLCEGPDGQFWIGMKVAGIGLLLWVVFRLICGSATADKTYDNHMDDY